MFNTDEIIFKKAILILSIAFFLSENVYAQTFSYRTNDEILTLYMGVQNQPYGYQTIGINIDTAGGYSFDARIENFEFFGVPFNSHSYEFNNKVYEPRRSVNTRLNDTTTIFLVLDFETGIDTVFNTLVWLNNDGDTMQTKRYHSPFHVDGIPNTVHFVPTDMCASSSGENIYFVSQVVQDGQNNFLIKKLTAQGDEVWTYVNELNNGYYCNAIEYFDEQIWFIRSSLTSNRIIGLDENTGEVETNQLITQSGLEYINPFDLIMEEGDFVVATLDGNDDGTLPIIYKCSSNGYEIFQTSPQGAQYDFAQRNDHLVKSPDGGYVSCSVKYDEQINPEDPNEESSNNTSEKIWLWKVDSDGNFLWQRFYEYLTFDSGYFYLNNTANDLKATPDGGYIMAGEATASCLDWPSCDDFTQQGWLLKVDGCGCLVPGCDEECSVGVTENNVEKPNYFKYGPNPVRDNLNVYVPKSSSFDSARLTLVLCNAQGQYIASFPLKHDNTTYIIDTNGLSEGIYVLSLMDGNIVLQSERMVVER